MNVVTRPQLGQWPSILRKCVRQSQVTVQQRSKTDFQGPEGHGERIWVFSHRRSDQIVYSFDEKLNVSVLNLAIYPILLSSEYFNMFHHALSYTLLIIWSQI